MSVSEFGEIGPDLAVCYVGNERHAPPRAQLLPNELIALLDVESSVHIRASLLRCYAMKPTRTAPGGKSGAGVGATQL